MFWEYAFASWGECRAGWGVASFILLPDVNTDDKVQFKMICRCMLSALCLAIWILLLLTPGTRCGDPYNLQIVGWWYNDLLFDYTNFLTWCL